MGSSAKARTRRMSAPCALAGLPQGFFKLDVKEEDKLPPQIANRLLSNGKLMTDAAIAVIQAAIQRIAAKRITVIKRDARYNEEAKKFQMMHAKYGYFGKKEIFQELTAEEKTQSKLSDAKQLYGVDVFPYEGRDVHCFKNPGLQGKVNFNEIDKHPVEYKAALTRIFGIGGFGKVVPLSEMNNPKKIYAVKIKNNLQYHDQEFKHAMNARLSIAGVFRRSPSHGGELQERIYMHYVPGMSLKEFFNCARKPAKSHPAARLAPSQIITVFRDMCRCIRIDVHEQGAVNRDIKLDNLKIHSLNVKLLDFGAQKYMRDGVYIGSAHGTAYYVDPESYDPETDKCSFTEQSDLYALGVMLARICDQVDIHELESFTNKLPTNKHITIKSTPSAKCSAYFPGETYKNLRECLTEMICLIAHPKRICRPQSSKACEEFFDVMVKMARAIELFANADEHYQTLQGMLQPLREMAKKNDGVSSLCPIL